MFDKQLCKYIGKSEISLGDVVCAVISDIVIASACVLVVSFLLTCVGLFTLILASPIIPSDYTATIYEILGTGSGTVIWATNIYLIWNGLFSIKIATCPKKQ